MKKIEDVVRETKVQTLQDFIEVFFRTEDLDKEIKAEEEILKQTLESFIEFVKEKPDSKKTTPILLKEMKNQITGALKTLEL